MSKMKNFASCVFLAGALLLGARSSRAATYYVSTAGNDSSAGTAASPFRTIQKGVNAASAGDTVIVGNGTYAYSGSSGGTLVSISKAGTSSSWITLEAQNSGQAFLNGSGALGGYGISFGSGSGYWIIKGFDIGYFYNMGIFSNSGGGNNTRILGNTIHNIGGTGNTTDIGVCGVYTDAGSANWTINGNVFHDVGRLVNGINGSHDHSLYLHGTNMIVSNNVFYNVANGWHVQIAAGFGGYIENNTFFGPDQYPGKVGQIMLWDADVSVRVANNIFYGPNGDAITAYQASFSGGCTIDHNIVYNPASNPGLIDSMPGSCTQSNNLLNVNPKLTTPSVPNYDFHLLSGSPAIDAGAAVSPQVTSDFLGTARPQGSAYDIGAFESAGGAAVTPPPAITAVSATGVGPTAATIVWTTNEAADSQVAYGATSAYGSATALNSTLTTSHSAALSGLTAGTAYHYAAKSRNSSGGLTTSPDAAFTTAANVVPPGCAVSANAWQNAGLKSQTGVFTAEFDATPGMANMDGVGGVSNGAATGFPSLAAAVRFNNTGMIDARNGGAYAASAAIPYVSGMTYHFRLVVNLPAHTYSAYVKQGSNAEQLVGTYAFRTEQNAVATLNNVGLLADAGTMMVCNAAVTTSGTPTAISAVSASAIGQTTATILWTTNNAADTQVQYGPTTAYGTTSTLNSTPTTSHSVALGGLTAGTIYHYKVMSRDAGGALAASPDATFTTAANTVTPVCATSAGGAWKNLSLTAQTGTFTAEFDATPSMANMDGVGGLSNGAASAFTSQAVAVRFNNTGKIDARNGAAYAAAAAIPYSAGLPYHFRIVVNVPARTYSAYVKQGANAEKLIGANYAFRAEQKSASMLNTLGVISDLGGSLTGCNAAAHP